MTHHIRCLRSQTLDAELGASYACLSKFSLPSLSFLSPYPAISCDYISRYSVMQVMHLMHRIVPSKPREPLTEHSAQVSRPRRPVPRYLHKMAARAVPTCSHANPVPSCSVGTDFLGGPGCSQPGPGRGIGETRAPRSSKRRRTMNSRRLAMQFSSVAHSEADGRRADLVD